MSYTKNTWQCGDVVTADKLNNIEDGIEQALECCSGGGSALIVEEQYVPCPDDPSQAYPQLNKTWNEIKAAYDNGLPVYLQWEAYGEFVRESLIGMAITEDAFEVNFDDSTAYSTDNADDYPSISACGK